TYVNNTNTALEKLPELAGLEIDELVKNLHKVPADQRTFVRNNAGGHSNHTFFWKGLKLGTQLHGSLKDA
ncbi:superoxide dismutase [Mn], partial [Proteus mirabilis]